MNYKFFESHPSKEEANVEILGVLLGKSAKNGVEKLRKASCFVSDFDLRKRRHLLKDLKIFDSGNRVVNSFQDLKMISEELERRYHDTILLDDKDIHFSQNHNYIIESSKDGTQKLWQVSMDDIGIKIKYIGDAWNTEVR